MELLFEAIFELVVDGCLDGAKDDALPKGIRIVLLLLVTLIYVAFTAFFVWLILTSENMLIKVIATGIVLLFVGAFISLWRKVLNAKK